MVRRKLIENVEDVDFGSIRLKHLLEYTVEDAIRFLVNTGALKSEVEFENCGSKMNVRKRSNRQDGLMWACRNNKKDCSFKSIRSGSSFENANLPLPVLLQIFYMWANDFDNKHIARELEISEQCVVDWLNICREVCQQQLGGYGKYIEIDATCIAKQKHHRGKPKRGASQWAFGGIERGGGGLMFAFRVPDRTKKAVYPLIRKHIPTGTTIISDDRSVYRKLRKQFGKSMGYKHYIIQHKKALWPHSEEKGFVVARSHQQVGRFLSAHEAQNQAFVWHAK